MDLDKIIFKWLCVGFCDRRNMCCLKKKKFGFFMILSKFDDVYLYNFIFFLVIFKK